MISTSYIEGIRCGHQTKGYPKERTRASDQVGIRSEILKEYQMYMLHKTVAQ